MLSKSAIKSFKDIYYQEFKIILSDEDANNKAKELLEFIKLIYKPINIENTDQPKVIIPIKLENATNVCL